MRKFGFLEPIWASVISERFLKNVPAMFVKETSAENKYRTRIIELTEVGIQGNMCPLLLSISSLLSITVMFESRNNSPVRLNVLTLFFYKLRALSSIDLFANKL